ncbi:MAG: hypothetical protein ACYS8W_21160 [Planctomycetota bacterium]|jgi:hypothetical protein
MNRVFRAALIMVLAFGFLLCASAVRSDDAPTAKQIGENMKKYLGEDLTFRDEITYIYKRSKWEGFFRFDTQYVSCRIPDSQKEDIELIKEMVRKEVEPNWLAITGSVTVPGDCRLEFVFEVSSVSRPIYPRDDLKKDEKPPGEGEE